MLTNTEKALAANAAVLLTKNKIVEEVYSLFGHLAESYQALAGHLPAEITRLYPKISRGENYLGLPWVMLDYPRYFVGPNTFAVRTMFWWGHYFSQHLLLQGDKMPLLRFENIAPGWYFSTGNSPWQHHYEASCAIAAENLTVDACEKQKASGFYKLSSYLPLQEWDSAPHFLTQKFGEAIRMVDSNKFTL